MGRQSGRGEGEGKKKVRNKMLKQRGSRERGRLLKGTQASCREAQEAGERLEWREGNGRGDMNFVMYVSVTHSLKAS